MIQDPDSRPAHFFNALDKKAKAAIADMLEEVPVQRPHPPPN